MNIGNTIRTRLMLISTIVMLFIIGALTALNYLQVKEEMLVDKYEIVRLEVQREKVFIEREFSKLYEAAQALYITTTEVALEDHVQDEREFVLHLAENIVEDNENIIGVMIIMEPDVLESDTLFAGDDRFKSDGQFVSYVSKSNNVGEIVYIDNYDMLEAYTSAKILKDNFFTEPHYFTVQNEEHFLSTVVFPIVDNGEYLGLIGVDFTSDYIFERILNFDDTYDRHDIILSDSGLVLLSTDDSSLAGENFHTIHPAFLDDIDEAVLKGYKAGVEHDGYEVVYSVDLGSSGYHWFINSSVDYDVLISDVNTTAYRVIIIGVILALTGILTIFYLNNLETQPITDLSKGVSEFDIEKPDYKLLNISDRNLQDVSLLRDRLIKTFKEIEHSDVERKRLSELNIVKLNFKQLIEASLDIQELSSHILSEVLGITGSIIGAMYVKNIDTFEMTSSSGYKENALQKFKLNDGLIGKVAASGEHNVLDNSAITDSLIQLGFNDVKSPNVLILPIIDNQETLAVIEVVSLEGITDEQINTIKLLEDSIANSINRQIIIERTKELLAESQTLSKELEKKQNDLEIQNEELESQQEELRVTNEEVTAQQEELRVANQELQYNMKQVELMNSQLENAKLELELRTDEAEQSNKFKSEFLANMSHELRTPLNSILILSGLIKENKQADAKVSEYANTINSAGKDLLELINGILDLSKVESGQTEVTIDEWDLDEIIEDLPKRYLPLAEEKGIELKIKSENNHIKMKTDGVKIKLILTNLISNAIKFTKKGSVTLNVIEENAEVIFKVIDTGIGIDSEDLPKIFEEFKQVDTKANRSYGGTGLGLSICKNYAALLKGRISVESQPGVGSTFSLILPKTSEEIRKDSKPKNKEIKHEDTRSSDDGIIIDDRHSISKGEKSVLVIDDDVDFLQSMKDYFTSKNVKVIVSDNGENGMYLADYYLPTLIIVDYRLPALNGDAVINRLNNNYRTKFIKKVLISGDDIKGKAKHILSKPLLDKDLNKIVKNIKSSDENKNRVLFVEDDTIHVNAVTDYIMTNSIDLNISIDSVQSKKEALKILKSKNFELLIVDLGLEDSKDFELVTEIRKMEKYTDTPIVAYTGKDFTPNEEKELRQYVQDIIVKGEKSQERLLDDIKLFIRNYIHNAEHTDQEIFKGKHVLAVDDDIRNIFALTGLLESYNIKVSYETSGKKALEYLKDNHKQIDLVLSDIMMPEMDGFETISRIRNDLKLTSLPIIALTAKTMRGDRAKCIEAGATEYLSKPIIKDKLLSVLRVWLQ